MEGLLRARLLARSDREDIACASRSDLMCMADNRALLDDSVTRTVVTQLMDSRGWGWLCLAREGTSVKALPTPAWKGA